MDIFNLGNSMDNLFLLPDIKSKRVSCYDKTGGNMDWLDIASNEKAVIADITGCGIIRHIWCTLKSELEDGVPAKNHLRRTILRMYWDGEPEPSVEAPLGDFFGMGFGISKTFESAAFSMNPHEGRGFCCYFPMPFQKGARLEIENKSVASIGIYYYVDYEELHELPSRSGYFHAQYRRVKKTNGWAEPVPGSVSKNRGNIEGFPEWYPDAWTKTTK